MSLQLLERGGAETLATDVDELLFPFVAEFAPWHNQEYGTSLELKDFHTYEFENVLQISIPETVYRVHAFLSVDHKHLHVSPIEEAREALEQLREQFRVRAITARHPSYAVMTQEYLDMYFGDLIEDVTLVGHDANMGVARTKANVCQEFGAVALIDDAIGHVTKCAELGIGAVLFGNYPWNQSDQLHPGIVRCNDWPAVVEHFNAQN
jgi:uncharacterized HAD superfamily protein